MASDPLSAFGGIVSCNFKINKSIANELNKTFFEVILAKAFDAQALRILKRKKNLRIIDISNFKDKNNSDVKLFNGSFLLQDKDNIIFNKKDLKFVTKTNHQKKKLKK